MNIAKVQDGSCLTVSLEGRLDTMTAPQMEEALRASLDGIETLVLNFSKLEYLSSAGLRVILATQKRMNAQGKMIIRHVNEAVREVFEVTGFMDILTVEE